MFFGRQLIEVMMSTAEHMIKGARRGRFSLWVWGDSAASALLYDTVVDATNSSSSLDKFHKHASRCHLFLLCVFVFLERYKRLKREDDGRKRPRIDFFPQFLLLFLLLFCFCNAHGLLRNFPFILTPPPHQFCSAPIQSLISYLSISFFFYLIWFPFKIPRTPQKTQKLNP